MTEDGTPHQPERGEQPTERAEQPTAHSEPATDPTATGPATEPTREQRPRRLYRSRGDKVIGGVSGGLGRYFNVDPIFFRIGFVALTLFGGAGVFLYLAAWIFVPPEGGTGPLEERKHSRALMIAGGVALAIAAIAALDGGIGWGGGLWWWGGFFPLLLIGLGAALVWRHLERRRRDGEGINGSWIAGRLALVVAIAAVSTLAFFASALAAAAGGGAVVAAIVIATGLMLVAAAFRGGARWLILPALLLALPAGIVSAAGVDLDGGIGDREYRPASASELHDRYELGIGRLEVDLRDVQFPRGDRSVEVDLGVGEAVVFVPKDVCVALDSRVGAGYAQLFDRDSGGVDVDWDIARAATGSVPQLSVKADVGLGALHVVHDESQVREYDRGFSDDVPNFGNAACQAGADQSGGSSARGRP